MPHPLPVRTPAPVLGACTSPAEHAQCNASQTLRWVDAEGHRFVLRSLQPADAPLLGRLWNDDLSRPSRFNRFHASLGRFSPERLRGLCDNPGATGGALLLTQLLPAGEYAVAEGRWAWAPGSAQPVQAELSLSVADHWQGRGLGLRMLQALQAQAREHGAQVLLAQVLPHNQPMRALLARQGYAPGADAATAGQAVAVDGENDADNYVLALQPPQRHRPAPTSPQHGAHAAGPHKQGQPTRTHLGSRLAGWLDGLLVAAMGLRATVHGIEAQH